LILSLHHVTVLSITGTLAGFFRVVVTLTRAMPCSMLDVMRMHGLHLHIHIARVRGVDGQQNQRPAAGSTSG
jgi:hypothetical protein